MATKKIRYAAQDRIIRFAKIALSDTYQDKGCTVTEELEVRKQFQRIEKLFGIVQGSTTY